MHLPPASAPDPGPALPRDLPPVVPGYVLGALLGRGGSGEVWRAEPRGGGPAVAVKILVQGDPEAQAREAVLLGALDHPHLVRLHEVVHQPRRGGAPRVALVLDLLEGGSLAALLARRGRLRPGEVVTAVAPVAAAVAHAHAHGVLHGDLSPGNVVFTAEGRPVLTDLGVARVLGEEAVGEVTPAYVDPVVARGGAAGPASDVFGLAAAAFHALTGVAPWNGATPADVLAVAATGELPDLASLAPEAPEELLAVVARGLAGDPHERGSASAFALDLRHACRPEPVRLTGVPVGAEAPGEASRTGRAAPELTHRVPGLRPRSAPRVVEPAGRWRSLRGGWSARPPGWGRSTARGRGSARRRESARHGAPVARSGPLRPLAVACGGLALLAVLALLLDRPPTASPDGTEIPGTVSAAAGGSPQRSGGPAGAGPASGATPAARSAPAAADPSTSISTPLAAPAPAPGSAPASSGGSPPTRDRYPAEAPRGAGAAAPVSGAPVSGAPVSRAQWQAVLDELYAARARAYAATSAAPLAGVYTDGSPLRVADEERLSVLSRRGALLRGFRPEVVAVDDVRVDGDRARVLLVDRWPDHELLPSGGEAARPVEGRPGEEVVMELHRTAAGWRIHTAQRFS